MKRLQAIALSLGDRINPVVIKELRQAVQSRMVGGIVMLFLLVNLVYLAGYLMMNERVATSEVAGRELFFSLYCILVVTCMAFVPLYAAVRLAMERNDANIDLLFVTTISPGKIVRGKFFAAVALAVLIYSSCMPFLVLTYLLRGIDLPSIFVTLGLSLVFTAGVTMVAIFASAVPGGWLLRLLIAGGLLFGMFYAVAGTIGFGYVMTSRGLGYFFRSSGEWTAWGIFALIYLTLWGLCYLLAVAALSTKASNRMMPVRVFLTFCWLVFGAALGGWSYSQSAYEPVLVWSIGSVGFFCAVLVFAVAERESWTPRVRRRIPRNILGRLAAWIFFTGSAGGVVWCLMIIGASLLVGWTLLEQWEETTGFSYSLRNDFASVVQFMSGIFLFAWNYTMTGLLVRRMFLPRTAPLVGSILAVVLLGLGGTIPILAAWMFEGTHWNLRTLPIFYLLPNPYVLGDDHSSHSVVVYTFLIAWALLVWILNIPWFAQQWQAFVRHQRRADFAPVIRVAEPPVPQNA